MQQGRLAELDALRGIAALVVLLFHYTVRYNQLYGDTAVDFAFVKYGYLGVHLFFMISGFVIFMTLSHTPSTRIFIIKRFIRLYPTYWICILVTYSAVALFGLEGRENTATELLLGLTMFQEAFKIAHIDGVYWSLTIELFFYLMMALFLTLGIIRHTMYWGTLWLLLIVVHHFVDFPIPGFYLNLEYGMLFLAGIMFYELYLDRSPGKIFRHFLIISSLLVFYLTDPSRGAWLVITSYYALFYLFVYGRLSWLNKRVFVFLGTISYALYLIHQEIGYLILQLGKGDLPLIFRIIIAATVSILLATLVTFAIEKPVGKGLKKLLLDP